MYVQGHPCWCSETPPRTALRDCSQTVVLIGLSISRTKVLLVGGRETDGRVWVIPDYKLSVMLRNITVPMTEERIMCKCEPQS